MFKGDIEKKIVEFVKKSPIGATSTEISKYLNINRITLAKYLSVIKEKTLIDFKQLGMSKLWYIPVNINDKEFLRSMLLGTISSLDENTSKEAIRKSALKIAKNIEELYKRFYDVEKLNLDQFCEAVVDVEKKIGGEFKVVEKSNNRVIFRVLSCPLTKCPGMCTVTSTILGTLAAKSFGYSKVILKKTIARGSDNCYIIVHLKKSEESEKEKTTEYFPGD
jgi:predicted ArsR family transcriptional regulator